MKLPPTLSRLAAELRARAQSLQQRLGHTPSSQLVALMRPNVGPVPQPLRRLVEPIIAALALVSLASLASLGLAAFAVLFIVAGLIYAIITHVFGIDLDIDTSAFQR